MFVEMKINSSQSVLVNCVRVCEMKSIKCTTAANLQVDYDFNDFLFSHVLFFFVFTTKNENISVAISKKSKFFSAIDEAHANKYWVMLK